MAGQEVPASFLEGHQDEHARRRRQAVRDTAHVEAARRERRLVLGPAAEPRAARRRPRVHQVEQDHRRDARHLGLEAQHGRLEPGPADARRLDLVRARLRESRSAAVRRALQRRTRARRRRRELGVGLPAGRLPRHAVPRGPVADPVSRPPRARGRGAATRQLRPAARLERPHVGALPRGHRAARARELLRARVPHGVGRARSRRLQQGDRRDQEALRPRQRRHGGLRHGDAARAPARRARRALRAGRLRAARGAQRRDARYELGRSPRPRHQPQGEHAGRRQADRWAAWPT